MTQNYQNIGDYTNVIDNRNSDRAITNLMGISIGKCYIPSVANIIGTDLSNYKVIRKGQFACSLMQVSRDQRIPIAMYEDDAPAIMSPAYVMFEVSRPDELLPEYMELWFKRVEFDREASFYAVGGVRGSLDWEDFCKMKIPVPPITEQRKVVRDYQVITDRIELLRKMNEVLNSMMSAEIDKMYLQVFGDVKLSEINKKSIADGWTVKLLSEIADCQSGYAFYQDGYDEDGIRVIDLGNINVFGEYMLTKSDKYISPEKCSSPKYDKYFLAPDDLIMVMTDRKSTMELLGKTGRIYDEEKLLLNQRVYRIRASGDLVSYLHSYLNSERVHLFQKSRALGTAQKYVNNGDINIIPVVIPPTEVFHNLCDIFNSSWNMIKNNLLEIRSLETAKEIIGSLRNVMKDGA